MLLGDVIKEYRSKEKLTLKDFSAMTGLSVAYINQLEKNLNPRTNREIVPSIETFYKVANAIGVSLEELAQRVDQNQPVAFNYVSDQSIVDNTDFDDSSTPGSISHNIKAARKALGFTLLDVANKVGVSEAMVQRWETGNIKNIKYDNIIKLSDVLQISPVKLMGWDTSNPIPNEYQFLPTTPSYISEQSFVYGESSEIDPNLHPSAIIGDRLRALRENANLTQDKLADSINSKFSVSINKSMISKWENGKSDPYLEYAKYLAIFFNVSLDYLLGLTDINDANILREEPSIYASDISKDILAVVHLMEREDARTQRFICELVRDYLNCDQFERGRLNSAASMTAERFLSDKVKKIKDNIEETTDIKEAK